MIRANHKQFWVNFSKHYSKYLIRFFFRNIKYIGEYKETNLPVLLIANHFSWWDGFIQIQLNNKYFKRRFHFMMLERELKNAMILTKIGACSISKGQRSSLESLNYAVEVLQNKQNLFLFFPQGKINSLYTQKFVFEKGLLGHILNKNHSNYQVVLNVNLIDYGAMRRPEISVYYKTLTINSETITEDVELEYNRFAKECFNQQCQK